MDVAFLPMRNQAFFSALLFMVSIRNDVHSGLRVISTGSSLFDGCSGVFPGKNCVSRSDILQHLMFRPHNLYHYSAGFPSQWAGLLLHQKGNIAISAITPFYEGSVSSSRLSRLKQKSRYQTTVFREQHTKFNVLVSTNSISFARS